MENNLPAIKIYRMDYSFLIKNYLNPEMWEKEWTLFEYKNFKVTMNIWSIQTRMHQIMLDIKLHYTNEEGQWEYKERTISFSMKIEDVTFLKRQINSAIFDTMVMMEKDCIITKTKDYKDLMNMKYEEERRLRGIALKFLEESGVTNENLVEAYVDAYIDEYSRVPEMIRDYLDGKIYTELTDLYLVWLDTLEDDPKKKIRTEEIRKRLGDKSFEETMKDIDEYKKYMQTEEFEDEATFNLKEV